VAADWAALATFLRQQGDQVTLSWREIEALVGGMPASSVDHAEWWNGDRPHTRAWQTAGFAVVSKHPGVSVTFRRVAGSRELRVDGPRGTRPRVAPEPTSVSKESDGSLPASATSTSKRVVLVSCAKSKAAEPMAAKDLYVSARFKKARAYAERSGAPWFILSAEHGLVSPDEWLVPYERYLPDTPQDYRSAWGEWVAARLELLAGPLSGLTVEVHAGEAYVHPMNPGLLRRGAVIERPLQGLSSGRWQRWYDARAHGRHDLQERPSRSSTFVDDIGEWIEKLSEERKALTPAELTALDRSHIDGPGLYSWFVDGDGAAALSRGLGAEVTPGLVYVGQTGATRWPSGSASGSNLVARIRRQHLQGRRSASTLRRTLGAILDVAHGRSLARGELSDWMAGHMRVVPLVVADADSLGDLERQVVQMLDPPLNLDHVGPTLLRATLKRLRAESSNPDID
jgi:hypothetical protein